VTAATESALYTYNAAALDPENQGLTYSLFTAPAGMVINASTGQVSWTPAEAISNYSANVTVRVSDGTTTVSQSFSITVTADNDAPSFLSAPVTAATESSPYTYNASASDPESQGLSYSLFAAPAGMSINASTGQITWNPPEATGNYNVNVTVRVSDGVMTTDQSFVINVSADNDAPVFLSVAVTVGSEGVAYAYLAAASDPEGSGVSYSLSEAPAGMSINAGTGQISWTPPQATGDYAANVTVLASDGSVSGSQAFTINVSAVNDAPVFSSAPVTAASESVAYGYTATATDPEGQPLTFSLTVFPAGMSINATTGAISWTPAEALSNYSANVTVRVSDGACTPTRASASTSAPTTMRRRSAVRRCSSPPRAWFTPTPPPRPIRKRRP